MNQLDIFTPVVADDGAQLTLDQQFAAFHRENPDVYNRLRELAIDLRSRGHAKGSIAMLFEVLRWEHALATTDPDFKLNNNYRAFYARLLMDHEPRLRGFFETRVQRHTNAATPRIGRLAALGNAR